MKRNFDTLLAAYYEGERARSVRLQARADRLFASSRPRQCRDCRAEVGPRRRYCPACLKEHERMSDYRARDRALQHAEALSLFGVSIKSSLLPVLGIIRQGLRQI